MASVTLGTKPRGFTGEKFPTVYTAPSSDATSGKPGQLPKDSIDRYFADGYLLIEDFFEHALLDECMAGYAELVDQLARELFDAGKISSLHENVGSSKRLTLIDEEFAGAAIILHKRGVMPDAVRRLWSNDKLLNVIEQLIGPNISGHPVWNIRTKIPRGAFADVPWHQDNGYFQTSAYGVHIPTAWIPFVDVTRDNGPLELGSGGHKSGLTAVHTCCHEDTWYVMLDHQVMTNDLGVSKTQLVPVKKGSFILFNNVTPHRSLPNVSEGIRWSIDLRFIRNDAVDTFKLKKPIVLRDTTASPDRKILWNEWNAVTETEVQSKNANKDNNQFDTLIAGQWMDKWEITNENAHYKSFKPQVDKMATQ